jgi:hypothetical protein
MRDNGHERATAAPNAHRWRRRFLDDLVRALGLICPA